MMRAQLLDPVQVSQDWQHISRTLAPAVSVTPSGMTVGALKREILRGNFHVVQVSGLEASGFLAFQMFEIDGELCCFASFIAGSVSGGPKAMVKTLRGLMAAFEEACRGMGVRQVFIGGRDWGRVFPDYELTGDVPNRRKKRL